MKRLQKQRKKEKKADLTQIHEKRRSHDLREIGVGSCEVPRDWQECDIYLETRCIRFHGLVQS